MKTVPTKRRLVMLLLIAASGCLLCHLLLSNWNMHARLSLLLRGYVGCHLSEMDTSSNSLAIHEMASKLVFSLGVYVGYLTPYAEFVSRSDTNSDSSVAFHRQFRTTLILICLQYAFLVLGSLICFYWIVNTLMCKRVMH